MAGIDRIISVRTVLSSSACPLCRHTAYGALLAIVCLSACGPTADFAGTWKGRRPLSGDSEKDPVVVETLRRVVLDIHANGRFDLFDRGLPRSGEWSASGQSASLTVDQIFDRKLVKDETQERLSLKMNPNGSATLSSDAGSVRLDKAAQPVR